MKRLIWLAIFVTAIFFLVKGWWNSQLSPVSSDKSTKIIIIGKDESFSKITADLKKQNLIKSGWAFNIYAKQTALSSKVQTGTFRISPSMSSEQILKALASQPLEGWVTLLEGWRVEEMAQVINSKLKIQNSKFLKLAEEGYMFPDTYLFPNDVSEEQIVKKLRDNFDQKYSDDLKSKIRSLGLTDAQGVILASMVEREARSDDARKMVASILLKRFKIGMGLNVDSTIQYALVPVGTKNPPADGWWKRSLSLNDLKIDSLYNTYIHAGLPPAPICNPGISSLQAVANADPSTPYLYYYHDSKGVSHYAKTLEEHNQNIADYP